MAADQRHSGYSKRLGASKLVKLTKNTAFKHAKPVAETTAEKTTRVVKQMIDEEAAERQLKNSRLRKARLEREASTPVKAVATSSKTRK
jgi:hypothetical protein